eukprot:138770_1
MLTFCIICLWFTTNAFQRISRIGLQQAYDNIKYDPAPLADTVNMTFNVLNYGAKGDGTTDDTAAFQATFAAAASGAIVFAPTGRYVFKGQLKIPHGVSLVGSYLTVPSHSFPKTAPTDGTVLMPYYGRGQTNETHSFITISEDASLKGVVIYYPEQPCGNAAPAEYPPSIYMNAQNAACEDIELLNSYIGIWAVSAHRHYIARVQGQPIYIGVFIDETYDIGRIEDVHFNPWFCKETNYVSTQTLYGRSFVFGRSDWEYVFNTFSFGYAIGYHFVETSTGAMNGNFLGLGADGVCNHSIQVDQSKGNGLLITNGEFVAFHKSLCATHNDSDHEATLSQVFVNKDNIGSVVFNSCSFWGETNNIARLYGNSMTVFQGCEFVQWNEIDPKRDAAAIYAENGNVIVEGCSFQKNGTQAEFVAGTKKAIISGNILKSGLHVKIDKSVKTAVNNNL